MMAAWRQEIESFTAASNEPERSEELSKSASIYRSSIFDPDRAVLLSALVLSRHDRRVCAGLLYV